MAIFRFVAHDGYDKEGTPTNFIEFSLDSKNVTIAMCDAKHHFKELGKKVLSAGFGKNSHEVTRVKEEKAS